MTAQQPDDNDAYVEHPDLDEAVAVDDHGPAFQPPDDEAGDE